MKKVMVFGTFDIIHPGHIDFFKQAREYGDYLIVVTARDINVKKIKGHYPSSSENKRRKQVHKLGWVDKAVLGYKNNKLKIIKEIKPDVICLGYDQVITIKDLKDSLKELNVIVDIKRLKPFKPDVYKSSKLEDKFRITRI